MYSKKVDLSRRDNTIAVSNLFKYGKAIYISTLNLIVPSNRCGLVFSIENISVFRSNPIIINRNLKALANEILYIYPPELIKASACLANIAELAVYTRVEYNVS